MSALDRISARSQLAAGVVAPRSGDVTVAAAGLERMRRLVAALGNPQRAYKTIHVAGSKGKGSTVAYAAAILTATGRKTGRYISPHLMDWNERIAVDGQDIFEADFDRVLAYVDSVMARLEAERPDETPHNAFELLTAAAFVHFAEVGCDAAVIEVGIGGRFDSTNVIDSDVSVITTIEGEHIDVLGPTLRDVAWNKAGIMRRGKPCVSVAQDEVVLDALQAEAKTIAASLELQSRDWLVSGSATSFTVTTPIGDYENLAIDNPMPSQVGNAGGAVVATTLFERRWPTPTVEEVQAGLHRFELPGRFEVFHDDPPVVLDVAHTAVSLMALGDGLRAQFPGRPAVALLGILADKDVEAVAAAVAGWADTIVATDASSPRARPAIEIAAVFQAMGCEVATASRPNVALRRAFAHTPHDGIVVVTGSFALVAELRPIVIGLR